MRLQGKDTLILTDPVMGDDGAVYPIYTEELRSRFCELTSFLCDHTEPYRKPSFFSTERKNGGDLEGTAKGIRGPADGRDPGDRVRTCPEIFTSCRCDHRVDHREEEGQPLKMGNLVLENGNSSWVFAEKSGGSYSGTGDLLHPCSVQGWKKIFHENLCRAGRGLYLGIDPGCGGGKEQTVTMVYALNSISACCFHKT